MELKHGIYAMPVLPNFYASHQWLRELKKRGARTIEAVYFRLRADAVVYVGHYNKIHQRVRVDEATAIILRAQDPLGFQVIVPSAVAPRSIHAVRQVPQVIGWRHFPESHEKGPWKCLCDFCLQNQKGEVGARKLRRRLLRDNAPESLNVEGDPGRLM